MMRTYIVDAFTSERFHGNPAGVCIPDTALEAPTMLSVAQELNLSETAFVTALAEPDNYAIRFFSPKMEIPLCGHATLSAAKVLHNGASSAELHFHTIDGLRLQTRLIGGKVQLSVPIYDTVPAAVPPALMNAIGLDSAIDIRLNQELDILLIEIGNPDLLTALRPDYRAMEASHQCIKGVVVTAPSKDLSVDFMYRYFWPWSGTNEDPATGGVQTFLAPYWSHKLKKSRLQAFQPSARTGMMGVIIGDQVLSIRGDAVIVFKGHLFLADENY